MDQKALIKLLDEKLELSNEQLNRLKHSDALSAIDIDLFLTYLRECYETGLQLKASYVSEKAPEKHRTESQSYQESDQPASEEEFNPSEMVDEVDLGQTPETAEKEAPSNEDDHSKQTEEATEAEMSEPEETPMPSETDSSEEFSSQEEQPESQAAPQANGHPPKGQPLHEKFRTEASSSLNDRLKRHQQSKALADKWQLSPVSDLKAAIKLNERQSFIKELFKGDTEAYRKAIKTLNEHCSSYSEALNYLEQDIKPYYSWNEESETTAKFVELVYRRFLEEQQ